MTCAQADLPGYREFSARVHTAAAAGRVPITGTWELTARCNLRCPFCYLDGATRSSEETARELSTAPILEIADQLVEAGCLWLAITGGEPLVRPDFAEIYEGLSGRGLLLTLCTNATLLTPALADLMADRPPLAVEVTLYGATAETYEKVTGVPGSFDACHRGIDLLRERAVRLRLKTTVTTQNVHELDAMAEQARSAEAPFRFDALLNPRIDGGTEPLAYRLPPERLVQLDDTPARREAFIRAFGECESPSMPREQLYDCSAGLSAFHIDAAGRLMGCMLVREPAVDLTQSDFSDGWQRLGALQAQKWTQVVKCRQCPWMRVCSQCPGWAILENQSSQSVVDCLCNTTHFRLQLFGF